ncbi:hypothetical protein ACET3X_007228 [Alternaria dauci]|uniref:Uncharacterized protein n=1 Tax=Alternaria dauci TaxID=48095 RepID=A0ABR3UBC6_9PLEO
MFEVDDYESDDGEYRGIRRLAAARLARPGEEHELIVKAESIWARKVTQQCEKAGTNLSALVKLFTHMPNLKDIEIREWSCDLAQYGFKGSMGREVGQQFAGCSTTWKHLELLSAAVQKANIHIASLFTPKINLFTLTTNGALESLFSSITALSFNVENADLLRAAPNNEPSPFAALLRQTSRTLEVLEFRNLTTSHPQIPNAGDILLSRIFGESHEAGSPDNTVPVFSRLKTLKLRSLYLSVPYLIDFVSQQPKLQYAHFDYVYLTPEGYKWSHVAERLPPSCKKLYIGNCGHDKFDPNTPTVDGHIKSFLPYKEGFPATSDWRVDESLVEQKMDNDEQAQKNSGWHMAPGPPGAPPGSRGLYRTTTREELRAKYRMAYSCAVFRRK